MVRGVCKKRKGYCPWYNKPSPYYLTLTFAGLGCISRISISRNIKDT